MLGVLQFAIREPIQIIAQERGEIVQFEGQAFGGPRFRRERGKGFRASFAGVEVRAGRD